MRFSVLILLSISIIPKISYCQDMVKPYIKDTSGKIMYFDNVLEGIQHKKKKKLVKSLGYTGVSNNTRTPIKIQEVKSLVMTEKANKANDTTYKQIIYIPVDWGLKNLKLKENDGMWSYLIDSTKRPSLCRVLFAKNDTLLLYCRMAEGSTGPADLDHNVVTNSTMYSNGLGMSSSPDNWRYLILISTKLYYIGPYLKKKKTQKSYQILVDTFKEVPEIRKLAEELLETNAFQQKKVDKIYKQISDVYFSKYYQEL